MEKQKSGVIILAGGNAERMGYPKLFLKFNQATFIEAITKAYVAAGIQNIVLVLNEKYHTPELMPVLDPLLPMIKIIVNTHPEKGRLHSVALGRTLSGMLDYVYLQNCDNPFTNSSWLDALWHQRLPGGYVIPCYHGKGGHPVLLSQSVLQQLPDTTDQTLKLVLQEFPSAKVEIDDERLLWNVNTPEDYEKLR